MKNRPRIQVRCVQFSSNVFRHKIRVKIQPRTNDLASTIGMTRQKAL